MSFFTDKVAKLDRDCVARFGVAVTYEPSLTSGGAYPATGIEQAANELEETKNFRVLFFHLADLETEPARGDRITIGSIIYTVFDLNSDEEGGIELTLQRV